MKILFDVAYLYYLPHFTPVLEELKERGVELGVVFREEPPANIKHQLEPLAACHVISDNQLINFYDSQSADWIIFGNSSQIPAKLSCS